MQCVKQSQEVDLNQVFIHLALTNCFSVDELITLKFTTTARHSEDTGFIFQLDFINHDDFTRGDVFLFSQSG